MAKAKSPARSNKSKNIHVITDGTGGLPRHFLTAILSQFPKTDNEPRYHVFCDAQKIKLVMEKEVKRNSLIFHALAEEATKSLLEELATKRKVPHFDLTGGAVSFITSHTGWTAANDSQRVHAHDDQYFDRIDAWEFTMQHDDSRRLDTIQQAEIILVGLSRVSKTPTSAYLGWLGRRVANVSFVPEVGLPKEVKKYKRRIVALTMQPKRLSEIRNRRMDVNGFNFVIGEDHPELRYAAVKDTIREVAAAEAIYRKMRLPIIDVTEATVEETAAKVLELLKLN